MVLSASRLFSTEPNYLKQEIHELGKTKVSDLPKTGGQVKKISRGLWTRYTERFFVRGGGSFMPVFHIMLGIGILGYSWEYSHLRELGIFTHIDKALVIQDAKIFNETPLKTAKCVTVLTKLLYLLYQGEKLTAKEATNVFFAPNLRRLIYLVIKELAGTAQDVIMVISSLTQDMNTMPVFKANAIRTLGTVVDSTMISGVERVIKQAIGDKSSSVASSALTTSIHFHGENREAVKRWLPEAQASLQAGHGKTIAQYHALGLLYLIKQNDRMALSKLVQQIQTQSNNMLATCLNLRIYGFLLSLDSSLSATPLDLKPFLRLRGKGDMVSLEAARIICEFNDLYAGDVAFAITTLQMFLSSGRPLLRFSAIRALNDFANVAREHVAVCNVDIEGLVADSNRNVATLAITTLLKTGNEASVDRLINQIMGYVSEISDEFKVIVVDAVRSLGLKFPNKHKTMLQFLGNVLREEGGLEYKEATVDAICQLLANIPSAREPALAHLCEFIEDCEYPKLTAQILHLLGEEGPRSENPAKLIRYIYNRLILEDAVVRVAAVGALTKLAATCHNLKDGIVSILKRCLDDDEDDVRDRAAVSIRGLEDENIAQEYFLIDEAYDLAALEAQLMDYVNQSEAAFSVRPFDIDSVPTVPKATLFEKARAEMIAATAATNEVASNKLNAGSPTGVDQVVPANIATRIDEMPQFAEFGPLYSTSAAVPLTDAETEYVVNARKHIFAEHLVIEFECRNTVRELVLENVQVQVQVQSASHLEPLFALPISKLSYDEPECSYVAFKSSSSERPEATFVCSLRFTAIEVDPNTGSRIGRGSTDEYPVESIELGLSDYIRYRDVQDFGQDWNTLENEHIETLELPSMRSISEAVKAVAELVGVRAHRGSDRVDLSTNTHSLLMNGSIYMRGHSLGANFAIRARFAEGTSGIAVELAVRSVDPDATMAIISAVC
ncbi:Coatomer subunit gamma [Paramicrosporidium saccamoebae]|uniref:Coatomer subunit gamma n=1 Tax=Paramicrosporidium saccamoebae TaxID=1246581 RepID=A0A2H9TH51_9FUNG|nr:Coatomer subunit gamma [Paramicrosporidium saccamoebae]